MTDVLILGAGPAGLTAAIYAARAGLTVQVFDKNMYGGQIALTSEVDNYPAVRERGGVELSGDLYSHATSQGAQVLFEEITSLSLDGAIKKVHTSSGTYEGSSIILAGGAKRRLLDSPGEEEFTGRGVSYCATCDAAFFRGKDVVIVGGGNTALEDALYLSNNCNKVYMVHRRDSFRGEKIQQDAVFARKNIEIIFNATVKEITGSQLVEHCVINTPEGEKTLAVSGVFVAVGMVPETALFAGMLPVSPEGYVLSGENCTTPLPGVYVAGDLRQKPLRQIVTAAADGAVAAVAAANYCNSLQQNREGRPAPPPFPAQP